MAPLFSEMAENLIGSEVLKIASEINALKLAGKKILNFTVGDFDPKFFPIPLILKDGTKSALDAGETNYPPSSGVQLLREAVARFYTREFGYPTESKEVIIAGGARPLIYCIFTSLLDPGDVVLFPVPSWNNNHYSHLSRARTITLNCQAENGFLPTVEDLKPHLNVARLLCLNSPLNPTGTIFKENELKKICEAIVLENIRRQDLKQRPLFVMYDQIYWKVTHNKAKHFQPVQLCPEMKPYTFFVDGISKYFCGTGLRVGWSIVPENMIGPLSSLLGHIGAWAPKPEQIAAANFLEMKNEVDDFVAATLQKLAPRLSKLFEGILGLKNKGLPVDAIRPEGGIYISLQIKAQKKYGSNESLRKALLQQSGIALVPFQAFGLNEESGWFRLSVGAVSEQDCIDAIAKLEEFLLTL
jgi:aspartate aminotransferase